MMPQSTTKKPRHQAVMFDDEQAADLALLGPANPPVPASSLDAAGNPPPGTNPDPSQPDNGAADSAAKTHREILDAPTRDQAGPNSDQPHRAPPPVGERDEPIPGRPPLPQALDGELLPPSDPSLEYEQRIRILEAWKYPGQMKGAPDWVDRNWIGYADLDPLRGIEAGPCLRVPLASGIVAVARIGDYVCKQLVRLSDDDEDVRIEVWPHEQFEKFFYKSVNAGTKTMSSQLHQHVTLGDAPHAA